MKRGVFLAPRPAADTSSLREFAEPRAESFARGRASTHEDGDGGGFDLLHRARRADDVLVEAAHHLGDIVRRVRKRALERSNSRREGLLVLVQANVSDVHARAARFRASRR